MDEELAEYHKDQDIEELADLLEVIYAATKARGYNIEDLERIRKEKADKRGAFDEKIMHAAYDRLIKSPLAEENLVDIAETICADLDRLLVEKIWPAEKKAQQKRQEAELKRQ